MSKRLGYALTALVHAGLAVAAAGMVSGAAWGSGVEAKGWTVRLMALPLGRWAVGLSGVALLSAGVVQLARAWGVRLDEVLDPHQLRPRAWRWVVGVGRVGVAARAVVFVLIGGSFVMAAWQADPRAARGLGEALETLQHQAYGPWLLGLVAVGLGAYGLYQVLVAYYRRIPEA